MVQARNGSCLCYHSDPLANSDGRLQQPLSPVCISLPISYIYTSSLAISPLASVSCPLSSLSLSLTHTFPPPLGIYSYTALTKPMIGLQNVTQHTKG